MIRQMPHDVASALRRVLERAGMEQDAMIVRRWMAEQERESSVPFVDPYHPYRPVRRHASTGIVEG